MTHSFPTRRPADLGRLQTAVGEGQRFRLPVLEEQLPVVGTVHGIVHQGFEPVAVEAGTRVEKLVGGGEVCHQAGLRAEVCVGLSIRSCCDQLRSEEHTSELLSLMSISYAVFCLKKKPHMRSDRTENTN